MSMMFTRLSSWSWPWLYGVFLAVFGIGSVAMVIVSDLVLGQADADGLRHAATALMPALGVLFSLLTGFVISSQWSHIRSAAAAVGVEADANLRLGLASRSCGAASGPIHHALIAFLDEVIDTEWPLMNRPQLVHGGAPAAADRLNALGDATRGLANHPGTSDPVASDLLGSYEAVAVARRDRLNLAGSGLPTPLFLLVMLSGVALTLNAAGLAVGLDRSAGLLIALLVVVIALDLALIVAISGPFTGQMRIDAAALRAVRDELRDWPG